MGGRKWTDEELVLLEELTENTNFTGGATMAALDAKTVNAKSVETVKLNCIQKVSSANNKRLWQLNKAYREAEHDLQLMESIGAISKKEVEETMDKMRFHYVKLGLEMRDGYED